MSITAKQELGHTLVERLNDEMPTKVVGHMPRTGIREVDFDWAKIEEERKEAASSITTLLSRVSQLESDCRMKDEALRNLAHHYDLNDCDERTGPYDALEVPVSELRKAKAALSPAPQPDADNCSVCGVDIERASDTVACRNPACPIQGHVRQQAQPDAVQADDVIDKAARLIESHHSFDVPNGQTYTAGARSIAESLARANLLRQSAPVECGLSCDGVNLHGDKKSIKAATEWMHSHNQIPEWRAEVKRLREQLASAPVDRDSVYLEANQEVLRGLLPFIPEKDAQKAPDKTGVDHLRTMVYTALTEKMPSDKVARWTGFIQGVLCARDYISVEEERDRTRPIFAEAAELAPASAPAEAAGMRSFQKQCANAARNSCLVPPDGGQPSEIEAAACDRAADAIMELPIPESPTDAAVKALVEACKPFSEMAGELFSRNKNKTDILIVLDNPGDPHRVTAGDFFELRRAFVAANGVK